MGRISRFKIISSRYNINNRTSSFSPIPLRLCLNRCHPTNNISSTHFSSSSFSSSNSRIMNPLVCLLLSNHLLKLWRAPRWWWRDLRCTLRHPQLRYLFRWTCHSWQLRINSSILRLLVDLKPSDRKCCNTSWRRGMHSMPRPVQSPWVGRMLWVLSQRSTYLLELAI